MFRAKSYVESINELKDLDSNSTDVIETIYKLKGLEKDGFDLLNTVPDNGATCSVQMKFYITAIIDRAKEHCDYCIEINVNKENPSDMNVSVQRVDNFKVNFRRILYCQISRGTQLPETRLAHLDRYFFSNNSNI